MGVGYFDLRPEDATAGEGAQEAAPLPAPPGPALEASDMLYVLGRREEGACAKCHHPCGKYHIQGIFTSARLAEDAALDETYFIGPLPVDVALPASLIEWAGLYWPRVPPLAASEGTDALSHSGADSESAR